MNEIVPACINCKSRTYMVRDRSAEKAGGILGAIMGAGAAYSSGKAVAVAGIAVQALLPAPLAIPITLGSLGMAALTGITTGSVIGQQIDTRLRMRYRCNRCGYVVKG